LDWWWFGWFFCPSLYSRIRYKINRVLDHEEFITSVKTERNAIHNIDFNGRGWNLEFEVSYLEWRLGIDLCSESRHTQRQASSEGNWYQFLKNKCNYEGSFVPTP
jgi:hypothetical protein